jgi:tetratricopeptide (TPR) repeat protein
MMGLSMGTFVRKIAMALTVLVVNTADAALPNSSSCTPGDRGTSVAACIQVNKGASTSTDELGGAALRYNHANALLQEGQIDAAVRYYTEAIGLQPDFALAYLNRGIAYAQEGLLGQSLSDLNEAVQLDPSSRKAFYNRGICYSKMGQFALAVADFSESIRRDPAEAKAFSYRGHAYQMLGDRAAATGDFRRALELDPTDAQSRLALFALGTEP